LAALMFSAVGCGGSEGVAGLPAATQPYGAAGAADSSVSDAQGDVPQLRLLSPAPDLGRDVTIEDNTAKLLVPRWVVGYPQSIQWVGGTVSVQQWTALDIAPDMKVLDWTRGATSEAPDAQNPELQPYQDLTYVRLREVASSRLEFFWRCRGDIPMDGIDSGYGAFIARNLVSGPDYAVALAPAAAVPLAPADAGWVWVVAGLGEAGFPWDTASYEDILSARVSQTGDGQLTFEMTTAQDIPAVPAEGDGNPVFSWILDQDSDGTVGAQFDLGVVVRWNAESGLWEGAVMSWDGQDYIDLDIAVAMTRSDSTVSATVDVIDLGLVGTFYWATMTAVQVGPDDEQFLGLADQAPDSGWVEETLAPTPGPTPTPTATATPPAPGLIYLPLISRGLDL
jgi:hypothetical protein